MAFTRFPSLHWVSFNLGLALFISLRIARPVLFAIPSLALPDSAMSCPDRMRQCINKNTYFLLITDLLLACKFPHYIPQKPLDSPACVVHFSSF